MAKVKTHSIDQKERYEIVGEFFEIASNLKTKREIIDFFVGLVTPSEMLMMARRIQVAEMILSGHSYDVISKKLKVSFQTIAKVYYWLYEGDTGYREQIEKQLVRKRKTKTKKAFDQESLLNKYAHHKMIKKLFE